MLTWIMTLLALGPTAATAQPGSARETASPTSGLTGAASDPNTPTLEPDLLSARPDWTTWRVGGDLFAAAVREREDLYVFEDCRITTALPVGYPMPTPPGAIELKRYPSVRRAEISGDGRADRGMNAGFWPLFRHISKHDIAMTSPVEMDYHTLDPAGARPEPAGGVGDAPPDDRAWTMSFLYRTPELRETGTDGSILVTDTPALTVVSIGFKGSYAQARVELNAARLREWLDGQTEWEAAGPVRGLFYNGPDTPQRRLWGEVQIPVRARRAEGAASPAPEGPSGAGE